MSNEGVVRADLFGSIGIAFLTAILMTSSIQVFEKPLLYDASLISSGRFAFIYDGYDTVSED